MIWISQDNYGQWRFTRKGSDGLVSTGSEAFAERDAAIAHAEHLFPEDEINADGMTQGAKTQSHIPLPQVDREREAMAGGYTLP